MELETGWLDPSPHGGVTLTDRARGPDRHPPPPVVCVGPAVGDASGLGHGYGVARRFPNMATGHESLCETDDLIPDGTDVACGDSSLSHRAFVEKVITHLEDVKKAQTGRDMDERAPPTREGVARLWGVTEDMVGMALNLTSIPEARHADYIRMMAFIPPPSQRTPVDIPDDHPPPSLSVPVNVVDAMAPPDAPLGEAPPLVPSLDAPEELMRGVPVSRLFDPSRRFLSTTTGRMVDGGTRFRELITNAVRKCADDGACADRAPGHKSRRMFRHPEVFPSCEGDLSPIGRKYPWNVDNLDCCVPIDLGDTPLSVQKERKEYDGNVFNIGYLRENLPEWPDEEMMRDLEYGLRFKQPLGQGVVIAPMNGSARPHLGKLREGLLKQVEAKILKASPRVSIFPSFFYPFGASSPNWRFKFRLTSDLRLHGLSGSMTAWHHLLSRNDNCDAGYVKPSWVQLRDVLHEGALLHSAWEEISSAHPESREVLRPCGWAEDGKSFFNMFGMAKSARQSQGLLLPCGKDPPLFISSDVLLFGSVPGPWWAQRLSCMIVALIRKRLFLFECALLELADEGDEVASLLLPEALAKMTRVAASSGGVGLLPSSVSMYIDDVHGKALGKVRAMAGLFSTWYEMESINCPYGTEDDKSSSKAQFGETTIFLGVDCFWAEGMVAITEQKKYILLRWIDRILGRTWVLRAEFESLWGTAGHAASFLPDARRYLGHGYRAKCNSYYVIGSKFGNVIRVALWMKDALRNLRATIVAVDARPFFVDVTAAEVELHGTIQSVTDAARTISRTKFSGMGGVLLLGPHAVMWHYRFDYEVLERLKIHVTEIWGSVTGILLISHFKELIRTRGGDYGATRCLERIDNMSVVNVIDAGKAKDIMLEAMLTIRADLLEEQNLTSEAAWIWTHSLEQLGDGMSRGKFKEVREALQGRGFKDVVHWDLNGKESFLIPDMSVLREYLLKLDSHNVSMKSGKPVLPDSFRHRTRK